MPKAAGWPPSKPRVAGASDLRPYAPGVLLLPEGPAVHPAMLLPELQVALPNRQRVQHHQAKHGKCLIAPLREHLPVSFPIPLVLLGPLCLLADNVYERKKGNFYGKKKKEKRLYEVVRSEERAALVNSSDRRLSRYPSFDCRRRDFEIRLSHCVSRTCYYFLTLSLSYK